MMGNRNRLRSGRSAIRTLLVALAVAAGLLGSSFAQVGSHTAGTATISASTVIDWP